MPSFAISFCPTLMPIFPFNIILSATAALRFAAAGQTLSSNLTFLVIVLGLRS